MKDCERIQESLGVWLDGELNSADSDALRVHLSNCADCRAEQAKLKKMTEVLRASLITDAGTYEFEPFWRALERRMEAKRPWYLGLQDWAREFFAAPRAAWAVPAAIALVLAVLSFDSYFVGWRGGSARNNVTSVDSIDAYGRSVALLREDDSKTMVIWLYQSQEDENEAAEESPRSGPAF